MSKIIRLFILACLLLASCSSLKKGSEASLIPAKTEEPEKDLLHRVPAFDHIVVIYLENKDYKQVIGSSEMPYFNQLANKNTLLTRYYAVSHPSLPNYIALLAGQTFDIHADCTDCFLNHQSLPDLLEKAGRTWKTYQEDMPSPCFIGDSGQYFQKHNPFIYFDSIRNNAARCKQNVVPLTQLGKDLKNNQLPNFAFIMPNICHSGHDCGLNTTDQWVKWIVENLQNSTALGHNSLIVITFDEGETKGGESCCGLTDTGGRVPAVLISPLAKPGYQDETPLTHYSLLKTILTAWNLPDLGFTSSPATQPIVEPWESLQ